MSQKRKRGIQATEEGIIKVRAAMAKGDGGKRLTYEKLAEKAWVHVSTIKRFLKRNCIDKTCAVSILNALNLEYRDIIENEEDSNTAA